MANLRARAETYLVLARAFAAPSDGALAAFRDHLADDLEALAGETGYDLGDALPRLRAALARVPDALALARLHAFLFLTPPAPVHINTAIYLDGAPLGRHEQAMRRWYAAHGLERAAHFRDLADHLVMQLELVATLWARAAEAPGPHAEAAAAFLATFLARWLPPFRADLDKVTRERDLPEVHLALTDVLAACVRADARPAAAPEPMPAEAPAVLGAEDLAAMAARLQEHGLSIEHLRARPEWREDLLVARDTASL
jgi:TorA maturation chaperone TorD